MKINVTLKKVKVCSLTKNLVHSETNWVNFDRTKRFSALWAVSAPLFPNPSHFTESAAPCRQHLKGGCLFGEGA